MKNTKLIFTALIALSFLAVLAFSGCSDTDREYTVKYEITGPEIDEVVINFTNLNKTNHTLKTESIIDKIPWEKTVVFSGYSVVKNLYIYCSAGSLNWNKNYTVNIYVDGVLKATKSSNGGGGVIADYSFK